ncbi:hypothetical protein [Sphingomonas sp.]|uniref:hypothetical protein n=1 Tax=Sphingomonas sp. TaxID=28214 RepID=UPI001B256113|nr:hypothetical protein [Sphingomonas sp.]MBO9712678.1 hypothetical protein [Sphingomonas sp.]
MSDESLDGGPIQPPKVNRAADLGRAAAKGVLGAVPVAGSLLAEAAGEVLPDPTEADRRRWEGDVTDGVNNLHGRVEKIAQQTGARTVSLTGGSAVAAKYMVEHCPDGLAHTWVSIDEIAAAYPDVERQEIKDGLGDLESYGLVSTISFIGSPDRYKLTQYGYEVLDPPIMGWSPKEDARQVAALAVKQQDGVRSADLEAALGWPRRRFNPALRIVVDFVEPGRVSQSLQPDYVTRWFSPNNMERAQLRRFAAGE